MTRSTFEVSADDIKGIVVGVLQDFQWSMFLEMLGKPWKTPKFDG